LSQKVWPLIFGEISLLGAFGCGVSLLLGLRVLWAIHKSGHLERKDDSLRRD
jgi:hypothetical protein